MPHDRSEIIGLLIKVVRGLFNSWLIDRLICQSVQILDNYTSINQNITRAELELYGLAAVLISYKLECTDPRPVTTLMVTAKKHTKIMIDDLIIAESNLFLALGFCVPQNTLLDECF